MVCKPCEENRKKKGFKYYSTEQQRKIAEARESGDDVNITVAKSRLGKRKSTS